MTNAPKPPLFLSAVATAGVEMIVDCERQTVDRRTRVDYGPDGLVIRVYTFGSYVSICLSAADGQAIAAHIAG